MSTGTRTLLAFLIVLIILLLYNRYLQKPSPKPEKEIAPQERVEKEDFQRLVEPEAIFKLQEEKEILVETELYRVVLSSFGGTIKSFQPKRYEGLGGGWTERIMDLEEWTKKEIRKYGQTVPEDWQRRKKTIEDVAEWMKKNYMTSPKDDLDEWIQTAKDTVWVLKDSYTGLGSECDELLVKIEKLPEWLEKNYTGWVELIPQGERGLNLDLGKDVHLDTLLCQIERKTTSQGEVVSFHYKLNGDEELTKTFIFHPKKYLFDLKISGSVEHYSLNWNSGLAVTEGNRNDDLGGFASIALMGGGLVKKSLGDLAKEKIALSGSVDWVGIRTKYFLACIFPENASNTKGFESWLPNVTDAVNQENRAGFGCMPYRGVKHSGNTRISVSLISPKERNFTVYVGPIDYEELKKLDVGAERIVDFGWSWIAPLSRLLFRVLKFFRSFIGNYGVVIIIFSLIMKLIFYPLTRRGTRSMRAMAKLQPEMKRIQKQYKNDPKRMNREVMELYRKYKVNPLGGCLPLLIQMPIFIALYSILRTTIEVRRASFISPWITDLSVHDPYYVLPLLMGAFMLLQSLLTPTDPRQRWTTFFMPVVITVIFLNFPAGLVLYWLVNNIFSVVEHFILAKKEVSTTLT